MLLQFYNILSERTNNSCLEVGWSYPVKMKHNSVLQRTIAAVRATSKWELINSVVYLCSSGLYRHKDMVWVHRPRFNLYHTKPLFNKAQTQCTISVFKALSLTPQGISSRSMWSPLQGHNWRSGYFLILHQFWYQ